VIGALILAALRAIAIDALAAFGFICLGGGLITLAFMWLFRHRRAHHKNTRGYL
jgi:hypothetical protein